MITEFRDIHAHFVYGMDDGAKTPEDMRSMLDEAYLGGIRVLYATCHSTPGVERFPDEVYEERLEEARTYCAERGYALRLYPGAEILYTPALKNYVERHPLRTLGNSDCVLVEFVPDVSFAEVEEAVTLLENAGYTPILAHVERYECLYGTRIYRLKKEHPAVRYQVNCRTVVHKQMSYLRKWQLRRWFKKELIDYVASDMHDTKARRSRMGAAVRKLDRYCRPGYISRMMGTMTPLR